MALPPEQENKTRRRAEILDADYVPREDVPNTPRTIGEDRSRRGGSPATAVTLCIALLALDDGHFAWLGDLEGHAEIARFRTRRD